MEESEFGKGLVICLVKFAEHRARWEEMPLKSSGLLSESDTVEMHFNAASDHLYEIEVPDKWKDTELGRKVELLQNSGLEIGHRFTGKKRTEKDVNRLYDLCRQIALLIDKELGLEPLIGRW